MRTSDQQYEIEGLRFLTVQSPALGGRGDIAVFVPNGYESLADLPLVVLLHGVYGSFWNWALIGGAHLVLDRMLAGDEIGPMVLVMPSDGMSGEGTAYLRHAAADYESWIVRDALDCVREATACLSTASPVMMCGASMGGYGAMSLGTRHVAAVTAISAHSAITCLDDLVPFLRDGFSTGADGVEHLADLFAAAGDRLPPTRFDCGLDDPLLASNRSLHHRLDEAGIPHSFDECRGGHDWAYWHDRLPTSLRFFEEVLGR